MSTYMTTECNRCGGRETADQGMNPNGWRAIAVDDNTKTHHSWNAPETLHLCPKCWKAFEAFLERGPSVGPNCPPFETVAKLKQERNEALDQVTQLLKEKRQLQQERDMHRSINKEALKADEAWHKGWDDAVEAYNRAILRLARQASLEPIPPPRIPS